MLLRLKTYTNEIYQLFLGWTDGLDLKPDKEDLTEIQKVDLAIASTAQTVLFFNQYQPDQSLDKWLDYNPYSYKARLLRALSHLEDCRRWAIASFALEDSRFLVEQTLIDMIKIPPGENEDSLDRVFSRTCDILHAECPRNTRLLTALERLYQSYCLSQECLEIARDVSAGDRLQYLKSLTRY